MSKLLHHLHETTAATQEGLRPPQQQQPSNTERLTPKELLHTLRQQDREDVSFIVNLVESGFSTLDHIQDNEILHKLAIKQMKMMSNILLNCLKLDGWEARNMINAAEAAASLVRPGIDDNNLDVWEEGTSFANPYSYGWSNDTMQRYNKLYWKHVLGTEKGREYIQPYVSLISPPTPIELADLMMRKLSITNLTTIQKSENALAAAKLLVEQLESNHKELLQQEEKRQLELVTRNESVKSIPPSTEDETTKKKRRTDINQEHQNSRSNTEDNQMKDGTSTSPMEEDTDDDESVDDNLSSDQEEDEPPAGDNTTPNQYQARKVKIDETLNIEFEFAPDSTEVSFDNDNDTPMNESKKEDAILLELVSFGTTEDQANSLNQIDAECINGYEAIAYSMIKDDMNLLVERVSDDISIESIPICDHEQTEQCSTNTKLPPLALLSTRGSPRTNNTTTTQAVHGLTALIVNAACKVLPDDTRVLKQIVAGLELDRRNTEGSDADHNICEILRNVDNERQVILVMEESLRLGLFDEVVEKLLIKYRGIHSNLKVLIVKEAGLHPVSMASINHKYHLEGQNITAECGGSKNPRDTSIEISSDHRKKQSGIDAEASVLMSDLLRRRDDNQPLPSQLVNGINNGKDFNSETITLVEDIFWDLRCLMSEGDLSEATVEEMFKPLLGKEVDGIKKMPLLLHRCSTKASHEATEKVSNVPVQQLSKNLVIGKKNGVVTNDSSLFITQAIRIRQSAGCNTDGHDDILRICAMILERRANALISTTVVRAGIDELALMVLKILCKMAGIPWLLSEEVGRELDDLIRAVQERQERMEARLKTRNSARENLVDQLSPFDKAFNRAMARIGSRNISKDKHLFQDVLIEVIKKRGLGRILFSQKTRDFWKQAKEDPSKLNDNEAILLVNQPFFKDKRNSLQSHGLKSNHVEFPHIFSPDEARDIITNVMSNHTVSESEHLCASKEYLQSWLDHNTKSTATKEATVTDDGSFVTPSPQSKEDKKLLKGKRFMICGEFEIPTDDIKSMLHSFGVARTSGMATRFPNANSKSKIDYLLVGQGIGTHDTTQRAAEKNIKVINLEKLQQYLLGAISSLSD